MIHPVVLFEDHTWRHFRPLAASLPTYHLRCGLFSLAERCAVLGSTPVLRCRTGLEPLEGAAATAPVPAAGPLLWLSGRLAPSLEILARIDAAFSDAAGAAWYDQDGLLAAKVPGGECAAFAASWAAWCSGGGATWEAAPAGARHTVPVGDGQVLALPEPGDPAAAQRLAQALRALPQPVALRRTWDLVPATSRAITDDLAVAIARGGWMRHPFGLTPAAGPAAWAAPTRPARASQSMLPAGAWLMGDDLWFADGVTVAPGSVFDTRKGPVILDNGVDVASHTLLEGPLYVGPGCRVKAGARIYGESSFGIGNRLAGEIAESTFGDFTNKQHEGFIGHAVLGSWVNLGAMTTCSDLKNNYGNVRVDLGDGAEDTGQRFVGLLAGDHVKTAIGTLFNTGTSVGFAANVFGGAMPPKFVPAFSWGGGQGAPPTNVDQAAATAAVVFGRRDCVFGPAHRALFRQLAQQG